MMKPHVDVRILKIELVDIAREFAVGDNALVYIALLEDENAELKTLAQAVCDEAEAPTEALWELRALLLAGGCDACT
jgi:hypothetical protein